MNVVKSTKVTVQHKVVKRKNSCNKNIPTITISGLYLEKELGIKSGDKLNVTITDKGIIICK
jgi:hypothetical protein